MNITEYADVIDAELKVCRFPNQKERWVASFCAAEVKRGNILEGVYGDAHTPQEAIEDYIAQIRGKRLVLYAGSPTFRREYVVPESLTL